MSAHLIQNADGADFQAQAALAYVRYLLGSGIEESWNPEQKRYMAELYFCRFDNCREQGYVVYLRSPNYDKQINIAFYEHRNSDSIFVQVNNQRTFNAPQLDDIIKDMEDKYDCAFSCHVGQAYEAAEFITETLTNFWIIAAKEKEN